MKTIFKQLTIAGALGVAFYTGSIYGKESEPLPPVFVQQEIAGATLLGEGQMRFFGLRIYDARLWVAPQFQASDFDSYPLALELTYHRAFSGADIARRSIKEIELQGEVSPAQLERWQQVLTSLMPDVMPGDRLTGFYHPQQGMHLWRGDTALGSIADAELARRFFGIWLSEDSSEPELRSALLAHKTRAAQ